LSTNDIRRWFWRTPQDINTDVLDGADLVSAIKAASSTNPKLSLEFAQRLGALTSRATFGRSSGADESFGGEI
jgi:hypothetical protein